jgi:hypothetical protein
VFASEIGGLVEDEAPVKAPAKKGKKAKAAPVEEAPVVKTPAKKVKAKPAKKTPPVEEAELVEEEEEVVETPAKKVAVKLSKHMTELVTGTPKQVLANAKELADRLNSDFYYLGGVLCDIADKKHYEELTDEDGNKLTGQPGFEAYVKQELGIEYRMAAHYMSLYSVLTEAGISEAKIKGLKWTKIAQLLKLIQSGAIGPHNWDEWRERIKTVKGDAFKEEVQSAMVDAGITNGQARGATANQKRFSFVLFDDRAGILEKALTLAKARIDEENGGDAEPASQSAAIDLIASEWMVSQAEEIGE